MMSCPCPYSVFLRGSHVNFMVLPDILKNAPFFKKIDTKANKASKSGKAKQAATQRAAGEARVKVAAASACTAIHLSADPDHSSALPSRTGRPTPGMPAPKGRAAREGKNPSFN